MKNLTNTTNLEVFQTFNILSISILNQFNVIISRNKNIELFNIFTEE